ncbi:MAG: toxic anion resistance protein [Candidimonas sp.]
MNNAALVETPNRIDDSGVIHDQVTSLDATDIRDNLDEKRLHELMINVDFSKTESLLSYGSDLQTTTGKIANKLTETVKSRDVEVVGELLSTMVISLKTLDVSGISTSEGGWFSRMLGTAKKKYAEFVSEFESTATAIKQIATNLDNERGTLKRNVVVMDDLFDENQKFYTELCLYIEAGQRRLNAAKEELAMLKNQTESETDPVKANYLSAKYADYDRAIREFERKIADLELTRTVTIQAMPQIRQIQSLSNSLINKIQTSIMTTIPIWETQMTMAIASSQMGRAAGALKEVADTTNHLLVKNQHMLSDQSKAAQESIERGVVDVETIKSVNESLISTIEDTLRIANEGRVRRSEAMAALEAEESKLRSALIGISKKNAD